MFYACPQLQEVVLSKNFSFGDKNRSILPTPPYSVDGLIMYTRKWVREDGYVEGKTPEELRDNYVNNASEWAGTGVWELNSNFSIVNFDANGGYTDPQTVSQSEPFTAITFQTATRPGYDLVGWNTEKDGSGTSYAVGDAYMPVGGEYKTFYAQWAVMAPYTVNYYQQNTSLNGYDLVETERGSAEDGSAFTGLLKEYDGFITPAQQTITLSTDGENVIDYKYDRTRYMVVFDGNGADSGTMSDQEILGGMNAKIYDNRFKRDGFWFTGWNTAADGSGTSYGDAQTMMNAAGNGETITLYAQWVDISNSVAEPTEGQYIVKVKPGQPITIPNLPAGTHYTITEIDNPDGWSQDGGSWYVRYD